MWWFWKTKIISIFDKRIGITTPSFSAGHLVLYTSSIINTASYEFIFISKWMLPFVHAIQICKSMTKCKRQHSMWYRKLNTLLHYDTGLDGETDYLLCWLTLAFHSYTFCIWFSRPDGNLKVAWAVLWHHCPYNEDMNELCISKYWKHSLVLSKQTGNSQQPFCIHSKCVILYWKNKNTSSFRLITASSTT